MPNQGDIPKGTRVLIDAVWGGEVWSVNVIVDGEQVGSATSPHGFLSSADEILYGDKNDWLNGYYGILGEMER